MTGRRRVGLVLLGIVVLVGSSNRALADVDLTGSWNLDRGVFGIITVDVVQSGTSLTIGAFTGTIDPATGLFMVQAPPSGGGFFPDGTPYGPSPGDTMSGTAADGNHFAAAAVAWIYKVTPPIDILHFPWFPYSYQIEGTRLLLADCGNGQIDPGEFCDDGAANGSNGCCSVICTVVDGDADGICDSADDCPTIYDPLQSCAVPLRLLSGQVNTTGRVRLNGLLSGRIGSFTEITVGAGTARRSDVIAHCVANPTNYVKVRCTNADKSVRLRLRRHMMTDDWTFYVRARLPPAATPSGPLQLEIVDLSNSRVGSDELTTCTLHGSMLGCVP